jgi:hypothetical protein
MSSNSVEFVELMTVTANRNKDAMAGMSPEAAFRHVENVIAGADIVRGV